MNQFAKVFTVKDGYQVLYTTNSGSGEEGEESLCNIQIRCDLDGVSAKATLGYDDWDKMNEMFATIEQENADRYFSGMMETFTEQ